jgi:hypothetical protein
VCGSLAASYSFFFQHELTRLFPSSFPFLLLPPSSSFSSIERLPNLHTVDLSFCRIVADQHLEALCTRSTALRRLTAQACHGLTNPRIASNTLQDLDLACCSKVKKGG